MLEAAGVTCGGSSHLPDPVKHRPAPGTEITPFAPHFAGRQGQTVPSPLSRDPKLATSPAPLWTVRTNPALTRPLIGDKMCQLMKERALGFSLRNLLQGRIYLHHGIRPGRPTSR